MNVKLTPERDSNDSYPHPVDITVSPDLNVVTISIREFEGGDRELTFNLDEFRHILSFGS